MTREEAIRILRKEIECLSHAKCEDCILEKVCDPAKTTPLDSEYIEAYSMAIQALEKENIYDDGEHYVTISKALYDKLNIDYEALSQEPCDDTISRKSVLNTEYQVKIINDIEYVMLSEVQMKIRKMPPVTQNPKYWIDKDNKIYKMPDDIPQKSGVWVEIDDEPHEVWECDHCGFVIDGSGCIEPYEYRDIYKYCPNCGARMVEPQESEDEE